MADLTRLLGDIYGPTASNATPHEGVASDAVPDEDEVESFSDILTEEMPAWDNEERLDEVFSSWQPGPDEYAAAEEHELVAEPIDGVDDGVWDDKAWDDNAWDDNAWDDKAWAAEVGTTEVVEHEETRLEPDSQLEEDSTAAEFAAPEFAAPEFAAPEFAAPDSTAAELAPSDFATPDESPTPVAPAPVSVDSWIAHLPETPVADVQDTGTPLPAARWTRSDDNILPGGSLKAGLRFWRR